MTEELNKYLEKKEQEKKSEEDVEYGEALAGLGFLAFVYLCFSHFSWYGLFSIISIILFFKVPKLQFFILLIFALSLGYSAFQISNYLLHTPLAYGLALLFGTVPDNFTPGFYIGAVLATVIGTIRYYDKAFNLFTFLRKTGQNIEVVRPDGHLLDSEQSANPSPAQPGEDYSEYRREGYIVRDYRVGRDHSAEGDKDR